MDKQLLRKSAIIATVITCAIAALCFGIPKISMGDVDQSTWTKAALKKDSVVYECLVILKGTGSPTIVFGSQTNKMVGTSSDPSLATLFLNTVTGNLEYKPPGTTTSYPLGSITASFLADTYATLASLSSYLQSTGGEGISNTFNSPQFTGTASIATGSVFTAGGTAFDATKVRFLADVTQNIQADIDAKLAKVGTSNTYLDSVTAGGKTGTRSISLAQGSDCVITSTVSPEGDLIATINLLATSSSKADIQQDGVVVGTQAANIDFRGDFVATVDGSGVDLSLTPQQKGSTTPTANTVMKAGPTGTSSLNWFDAGFCYAYKTIPTGSVTAGTWTNVGLDSDLNDSRYGTHSTTVNTEQIKILVPGMYEIAGMAHARTSAASIGIRVCKNSGQEIPGSFVVSYMNYGDGNSGMPIVIAPVHARLNANDYIYMQVAHNHSSNIAPIDYTIAGTMPSPGTSSYAHLSIRKIGE